MSATIQKIKGFTLFSKLLLLFVGIVAVVISSLTIVFYTFSKNYLEEHTQDHVLQQFVTMKDYFSNEMQEELIEGLQLMTASVIIDSYITASQTTQKIKQHELESFFAKHIDITTGYEKISYVGPYGEMLVEVDKNGPVKEFSTLGQTALFREIEELGPGGIAIDGPTIASNGSVSFLIGIGKIDPDIGEFGGAIILEYAFEELFKYVENVWTFGENTLWIFTPDGRIIKKPEFGRGYWNSFHLMGTTHQRESQVLLEKKGMMVYQDFFIFPDKPILRMAISIPSTLLYGAIDDFFRFFTAVAAITILATVIAVYIISKFLAAPIVELAQAVPQFKRGNFNLALPKKYGGEVGLLIDSFNNLAKNLEKTTVSRAYLDNIIDNLLNPLVVVSASGQIQRTNNAILNLLGYEKTELLDQPAEILFADKDVFAEIITHEKVAAREINYQAKDGLIVPMLFSAITLEDEETDSARRDKVFTAQDITVRKQDEAELKAYAKMLSISNKELQDFTYVASHDLQEPLRKITTFGERLRTKCGQNLTDQCLDYLSRMENAASRMHLLITGLLNYSRVTTEAKPFTQIDLMEVTQGVLSDLEIRIEETQATIKLETMCTIEADELQMRQLIQNLLSNALKFTRPEIKPEIVVSATISTDPELNHKTCQITVSDNGIGFDEKYLDRIFGVFQRLHGRKEYQGTGVGLAICRKIIERHGGQITAKTKPGQGATFLATLPGLQSPKRGNG